jgi:hypothetical protein
MLAAAGFAAILAHLEPVSTTFGDFCPDVSSYLQPVELMVYSARGPVCAPGLNKPRETTRKKQKKREPQVNRDGGEQQSTAALRNRPAHTKNSGPAQKGFS